MGDRVGGLHEAVAVKDREVDPPEGDDGGRYCDAGAERQHGHDVVLRAVRLKGLVPRPVTRFFLSRDAKLKRIQT